MILAFCLLPSVALDPIPQYKRFGQELPYRAKWGSYTVLVEHVSKVKPGDADDDVPQRVRIFDKHSKVVREIRGLKIASVDVVDITGKGSQELHISHWSGGAYCCTTDLLYTRQGGLRNILYFWGRHLGIQDFKDLDRDGRKEIVADSPILQKFSGWTFSRSASVPVVWKWRGGRLVDVTRTYMNADKFRPDLRTGVVDLLKEKSSRKKADIQQWEWMLEGAVTGYYGNRLKLGRGSSARAWLLKVLPSSEKAWLRKYDPELRRLVAQSSITKTDNRATVNVFDLGD